MLHNKELNDLYSLPNIVRVVKSRIKWAGHVARIGEERGVHRMLVGKPEGKRPLGRPRRRWEDNIACSAIFSGLNATSVHSPRRYPFTLHFIRGIRKVAVHLGCGT
jgi:hypothetical protein